MKGLNIKFRVVLGLAGLTITIVMLAFYSGVIPDRDGAVRGGRASLAEAIALHSTAFVLANDFDRLDADFKLMAKRNSDLLSLGLRRSDGHALATTGDHQERWRIMDGEYSDDMQVRVPIYAGEQQWGQLELRFAALGASGFKGMIDNPIAKLSLFMGVLCFAAFYFYMGKVLRHLDPSKAIPGQVRSALDSLAGGLLILDNKEQIVLANRSFATLLGKAPEDLMGYRAGDLPWVDTNDKQVEKASRPWVQALKKGEPQTNRILRLRMPEIGWITFTTNCSPVLGAGGKYAGVLVSFDDVTQLEKKEIELQKSKDEAETANQAKSAFLANMSHEIRTPMTAILGFTEILKRGYGKNMKDSLRYLDTIHSSGQNLLDLINDILDLSKVESGRLEMESAWTEPHRIVNEVLQVLKIKAHEKGIDLNFKAKSALPQQIETDPARFRQIVFNIVGNAIKFTGEGSVTVACQLQKSDSGPKFLVDISDTGIGIPAEKIDTIFDPFTQADSAVTRRFGGTGLGLSISREFARALGGDITIQSQPGKGSTFQVSLSTGDLKGVAFLQPEEVETAAQVSKEVKPSRWQFPDARVLVVDDGTENRELLRLFLEEAGLTVDEAENGQIGVDKALATEYALILMDVNMPVMDGFTATGKIRQQGMKTPIIALTANAMKGFEQKCLDAGYSGYSSKPIDIDRLMKLLADLLGGQPIDDKSELLDSPDDSLMLVGDTPSSAAAIPIVSKLPANNERFRSLIVRFITRLREQLETAKQACVQGKHKDVAEFAHWLKGAGGTVGFDDFTAPTSKLEALAKACADQEDILAIIDELNGLASRLVLPDDEASTPISSGQTEMDEIVAEKPLKAIPSPHKTDQPIISRLGGHPRFQPIILQFVEKLKTEMNLAENAFEDDDMQALAMFAHWLKGSGGTVGFDAFTAPATKLETYVKAGFKEPAGQILRQLKAMSDAIVPPAAVLGNSNSKQSTTNRLIAG